MFGVLGALRTTLSQKEDCENHILHSPSFGEGSQSDMESLNVSIVDPHRFRAGVGGTHRPHSAAGSAEWVGHKSRRAYNTNSGVSNSTHGRVMRII